MEKAQKQATAKPAQKKATKPKTVKKSNQRTGWAPY